MLQRDVALSRCLEYEYQRTLAAERRVHPTNTTTGTVVVTEAPFRGVDVEAVFRSE